MTIRVITDSNGRKHITSEPLLRPPQKEWVSLMDEDIDQCLRVGDGSLGRIIAAIEAKLKELNT